MDQQSTGLDSGGPAFPGSVRNSSKKLTRHPGMSLREWFAGKALTGILTKEPWFDHDRLVVAAYAVADAMIAAAHTPRIAETAMSQAAQDVLAERQRQISVEGWTPGHDDQHDEGELAAAAAAYAFSAATFGRYYALSPIGFWPWGSGSWKPTTPRRDLVKAGALILAEIEREDREAARRASEDRADG